MRKVTTGLMALVALGLGARSAGAVEIDSKAEKITITGRIQTGWYTSTIKGDPGNEFLVRRARMALKLKINNWLSGVIEPDFASGVSVDLKDCYVKGELSDNVDIILGQTKRRFDLFELTSSTQILVIERDGRIGRRVFPTLSSLTEGLNYSDRDVGVFVLAHDKDERCLVEAAVTNGVKTNTKPQLGAKAFQGRVSVQPMKENDLTLNAGVSVKPFRTIRTVSGVQDSATAYGSAFEGSVECGSFKAGPHLQAGVVLGTNDTTYDPVADESQKFFAVQAIATYKKELASNKWFESVEPLVRIGLADPNTDTDASVTSVGGLIITPGVNLFVANRSRLSANIDIYFPEEQNVAVPPDHDTQISFKAASWIYF